MRRVTQANKDIKTGHEVLLTDATFNMAMDWLLRELKEKGNGEEIQDIEYSHHTEMFYIFTGFKRGASYVKCRTYYYDEIRGYLLGE